MNHVVSSLAFGLALGALACGTSSDGGSQDQAVGQAGEAAGGTVERGGDNSKGGADSGGTATGGQAQMGGDFSIGGRATGGIAGTGGRRPGGGTSSTGGLTETGGLSETGGRHASGGGSAAGGRASTGGSSESGGASEGGATSEPGGSSGAVDLEIPTECTSALPSGAEPVDVSNPTSVVGTGTPESCSFQELQAAVAKAGIISFDCGGAATIPVTETLELSTEKDTVIDGGGRVTLDGQHAVRIMNYHDPDWMTLETRVTLQHLRVINGKTTPTEVIPDAPPPCSQGYNDGEGGALFMRNGNLTVIDCTFSGNQAAPLGPDTGGGAIYINGSKHGVLIVGSVFTDNSGSNAGAVGGLFAELQIYNSLFQNNEATGNGANNDDEEACPDHINNGQHEVGSGGNGGAIYQDGGASTNVVLCGVSVLDNAAGEDAFGGGVFMTSNDWSGTITIRDSVITGNAGRSWTIAGDGDDLGSAFGVNAKDAIVENSTLQDT